MPYIGPPYDIKLITGVSGLLHWKKLCSFRTGLEAATSTIEIITARLLQCTNHRCSYGTNDNYSPIRTSRTLCDIFVIYFCVVFFVLYILCCIFVYIFFVAFLCCIFHMWNFMIYFLCYIFLWFIFSCFIKSTSISATVSSAIYLEAFRSDSKEDFSLSWEIRTD